MKLPKNFDGWTWQIKGWVLDLAINRDRCYQKWGYLVAEQDMIVYRAIALYWITIGWHNPDRYE